MNVLRYPIILFFFLISVVRSSAVGEEDNPTAARYPYESELGEGTKVLLHVGFSAAAAYASCFSADYINDTLPIHKICALGFTFGLIPGVAKECYDKWIRGYTFDWDDIGMDAIGSFVGTGIYYILFKRRYRNTVMLRGRFGRDMIVLRVDIPLRK